MYIRMLQPGKQVLDGPENFRTVTERKGITGTSKTRRKLEVADRENPSSCPSRAPSSACTSVRFFQAALKGVYTSDFIPEAAQGPCRGLKETSERRRLEA
eukprot:scaffold3927_cov295-Pinguiococcus_pyrenoidosus.AAC.3